MRPLFASLHKKLATVPPIPFDTYKWPNNLKTIETKEYPRFPLFQLPQPVLAQTPYEKLLLRRVSNRDFADGTSIASQTFSNVLHAGAGISRREHGIEHSHRFYPSGGGRYPLELYLSLRGNQEIPAGLYHYNVGKHALEQLLGAEGDEQIRALPTYPWVKDAAAIALITIVLDRTTRKYGLRGYRFALMEAGILTHNLYLASAAEGLACCAVGSNNDRRIEEILDIDGENEFYVGQVAFGPPRNRGAEITAKPL